MFYKGKPFVNENVAIPKKSVLKKSIFKEIFDKYILRVFSPDQNQHDRLVPLFHLVYRHSISIRARFQSKICVTVGTWYPKDFVVDSHSSIRIHAHRQHPVHVPHGGREDCYLGDC